MIDPNKEYQTAEGQDVRIYTTTGGGNFPVHGAVMVEDIWIPEQWNLDGVHKSGLGYLELCKKVKKIKTTFWINLYPYGQTLYIDKLEANKYASNDRVAMLEIVVDCASGYHVVEVTDE